LAASFRDWGWLTHIEARHNPENPGGPLQITFGHRRWLAAKAAGQNKVLVRIVERTDEEMLLLGLIENDTFEALTPLEQALHLRRIQEKLGWKMREMAIRLGHSKGWVQGRLDLLRIPEGSALWDALRAGQITMTDATTLRLMPLDQQEELLPRVLSGELTIDDLRSIHAARLRANILEEELTDEGDRIHTVPLLPPLADAPARTESDAPPNRAQSHPSESAALECVESVSTGDPVEDSEELASQGWRRDADGVWRRSAMERWTSPVRDRRYLTVRALEQLQAFTDTFAKRMEQIDLSLLTEDEGRQWDACAEVITPLLVRK
jgi:ParB/RepB/Spo0J family partition protein